MSMNDQMHAGLCNERQSVKKGNLREVFHVAPGSNAKSLFFAAAAGFPTPWNIACQIANKTHRSVILRPDPKERASVRYLDNHEDLKLENSGYVGMMKI